jgi:hypothetical protein
MYLRRSRAPVPAEDQREQVTLLLYQRRKRVHHLLDVGVKVAIVAARGTVSAALPWRRWDRRETGWIGAIGGTGREAFTSVRDGRPESGQGGRDDVPGQEQPTHTRQPGQHTW